MGTGWYAQRIALAALNEDEHAGQGGHDAFYQSPDEMMAQFDRVFEPH